MLGNNKKSYAVAIYKHKTHILCLAVDRYLTLLKDFLLSRPLKAVPKVANGNVSNSRATIPWLDSVTYFRPGSCGRKISFKFSDKTLKTYVNGNTLKLSPLQKWRRDVLVQ